jgi:hypothetical protein
MRLIRTHDNLLGQLLQLLGQELRHVCHDTNFDHLTASFFQRHKPSRNGSVGGTALVAGAD